MGAHARRKEAPDAGGELKVRELAAATPASRDRVVDGARVLALVAVMVGHWLAAVVTLHDGEFDADNVLGYAGDGHWTHWVTWVFQVMGLVFVVGGFANAASWRSARRRGREATAWYVVRVERLLRPTAVFVGVGVSAAAVARVLGADPASVEEAAWGAGIGLWFLAVYIVVCALAPASVTAHDRFGWRATVVLAVLVAAADVATHGAGMALVSSVNYLLAWLLLHQLGVAWQAGAWRRPSSGVALALLAGGAALGLTAFGPYPVSMVGVPGADIQNTAPPTVALVAFAVAQAGVLFASRPVMQRVLDKRRVWIGVVALNGMAMSLYLWHMVAVVIVAAVLLPLGLVDQPAPLSADWLASRPLWLAALSLAMVALLAVFARFERPSTTSRSRTGAGRASPPVVRVLTALGMLLAVAGLVALTLGGLQGHGPLGIPVAPSAAFAAGMAALAAARRWPLGATTEADDEGPSAGGRQAVQ